MPFGPMKPDGGKQPAKPNPKPTVFRPVAAPTPPSNFQPALTSNSSGQYSSRPTPPPPNNVPGPVPDINAFLGGDSGYQDQLRQLAKALTDFQADSFRRKGNLESEFGVSEKALRDQRGMDLDLLKDDYGARGLLRSGLYANAVGDYEKEFGERVADIGRRQTQALELLQQETGQFTSQQELAKQAAREAALRRRAEQFGV